MADSRVKWSRGEPINGVQAVRVNNTAPTILEEYYLIFFGSRQQQNIYITSHGSADGQQFTPTLACQFYLQHGGRLTYHTRNFPRFDINVPGAGLLHAANAANCQDYKLSKYQGRHSADVMSPETYARLADKSIRHDATFVTIRNRLISSYLRLSYVLERIAARCPNVATVHCLFCRETTPAVAANDLTACPNGCILC